MTSPATSPRAPRNLWPLLPVLLLGATLVANIVLIRLATTTDDVLLRVDDREPAGSHPAAPAERGDAD
jgi:hypothetical protein